jgi:uncharacterized membrane protein YraQ (UPF0718 family)
MTTEIADIVLFVATAVWRIVPAFFLSVCLGVLVRALHLDGLIRQAFYRRMGLSIVLSTAVGAFNPFCSCTVVPVINGLLVSGVPLAPVMAFWIASPLMDPEIFSLSVALLGWPLACARLGATLVVSLGAGVVTLALTRSGWLGDAVLRAQPIAGPSCCTGAAHAAAPVTSSAPLREYAMQAGGLSVLPPGHLEHGPSASCCAPSLPEMSCGGEFSRGMPHAPRATTWTATVLAHARDMDGRLLAQQVLGLSWGLGRWLVLACLLEALMLRYVPQTTIASVLGSTSLFAVPVAALVGIPLYLGNVSALPIVSGLLTHGMQSGAAIAFLIAGPVTTIPAMSAVWGIVRH